jgi:hypothetical protein
MRQFIAFDEHADFPWKNPPKKRTREQDYLTMFDEGGCILATHLEKGVSIPFLFGHGIYERVIYGDMDISACTFELILDNYFLFNELKYECNGELNKEYLLNIDNIVACILADRNFYEKESVFKSVHLKEFLKLVELPFFSRSCIFPSNESRKYGIN